MNSNNNIYNVARADSRRRLCGALLFKHVTFADTHFTHCRGGGVRGEERQRGPGSARTGFGGVGYIVVAVSWSRLLYERFSARHEQSHATWQWRKTCCWLYLMFASVPTRTKYSINKVAWSASAVIYYKRQLSIIVIETKFFVIIICYYYYFL